MKNFIISESEKKQILSLYNLNKKVINEQWSAIEALFGKNLAKHMSANMSDDIVRSIETKSGKILRNSDVIFEKGGQLYLRSASGAEVSTKVIANALDAVVTGKLSKDAVLQSFPRTLKDGTEFRSFFDSALMNLGKKPATVVRAKGPLQTKWTTNPQNYESLISSMEQKLDKLKNLKFKGKEDLKIVGSENISGRAVLEVKLPTNDTILIYRSSGSNVATTGKKEGEWFVIPGFSDRPFLDTDEGWFIKTDGSINLTRTGNQYMTDMANWLYKNWGR